MDILRKCFGREGQRRRREERREERSSRQPVPRFADSPDSNVSPTPVAPTTRPGSRDHAGRRRQSSSLLEGVSISPAGRETDRDHSLTQEHHPASAMPTLAEPASGGNTSIGPSAEEKEKMEEKFKKFQEEVEEYKGEQKHIEKLIAEAPGMYNISDTKENNEIKKELEKLAHLHHLLKEEYEKEGFKILVRFYVGDENAGTQHPGINSWAFLENSQPELTPEAIEKLAGDHMKYGHDTGQKDIVNKSPLVSTTGDIGKLMLADSQYNQKIIQSRMNSQQVPGQKKKVAKYYSQRIDKLMYGHSPSTPRVVRTPVANKIAFLAIKDNPDDGSKHLFTPDMVKSDQEDQEDCYRLEDEHTIYAPSHDLNQFVIGDMDNPLPELKYGTGAQNPGGVLKR
jgi:hypothetical protein